MEQATTIGLDIAKHVFQVHGADAAGHVLFRKRITRVKLLGFWWIEFNTWYPRLAAAMMRSGSAVQVKGFGVWL